MNILKNLIKLGMKSKTIDVRKIKSKFLGQEKQALKIIPYGIMYKLPDNDIMTILIQQEANEDSLLAFCTDIKNRDDDLNELEVALGIPTKKCRIRFTDDDKIKVKLGAILGGDFAVRYTELETAFNQLKSDFDNHVHTNASSGFSLLDSSSGSVSGSTGSPTASSSADITPAKITDFELPEK